MDGKMNNEPVAIVNTNCENNIQWYDDNPKQHNGYFLYTHPADTIPYKDLHQMVKNVLAHPVKEPTDLELLKMIGEKFTRFGFEGDYVVEDSELIDFARAILRKAQEK